MMLVFYVMFVWICAYEFWWMTSQFGFLKEYVFEYMLRELHVLVMTN